MLAESMFDDITNAIAPYLENQRVFIAGDSVSLNPNHLL